MKRLLPLPALCGALFASLAAAPLHAAPTLTDTVDLSPGKDATNPQTFALNATTHKLYVLGGALKVIDTTTGAVTASIKLGAEFGDADYDGTFLPGWVGADSGTGTSGNKVYVAGIHNTTPYNGTLFLRVVDGATNTNLTTGADDINLGTASQGRVDGVSVTVNPVTHKVYVAAAGIIVVDGPSRQVVSRLITGVDTPTVSAVNRATNKLYFFSIYDSSTMAIVDGATDAFTNVTIPFRNATAAVVDEGTGRIYVVAYDSSNGYAPSVYMLDANGNVLGSTHAGLITNSNELFLGLGFDPDAHVLYVSNGTDGYPQPAVTALDASTLAVAATYAGGSGSNVTFDAGRAFLLNRGQFSNAVGILTPSTGAFSQTVVAYQPGEMAVDTQRSRVYVRDRVANEVVVIDSNTGAVVSRFRVRPLGYATVPNGVAVSTSLNRFYLTYLTDTSTEYLDSYDAGSGQFLNSVALETANFASPGRVALDDTHHVIYVSGSTAVYALDADTNALLATIPGVVPSGGITANGMAVNPVTRRVYISFSDSGAIGAVKIIDGATNTLVASVTTNAANPGRIAINTKTNKVYVANHFAEGDQAERNQIDIIDGATDQSAGYFTNVLLNGQTDTANDVAVDETTNSVYIADPNNDYTHGRVTAFDAGNNYAYLGEVELGRFPAGIAFDPKTRNLLVSNRIDGTVSRLHENSGAAAHPAFFNGEVALGQGVYYLAFPGNGQIFGYYEYLSDPRFIYHFDLGYEFYFDSGDGSGSIYFYDFKSQDFFYTSPTFSFPYLYDFNLHAFLYYYPDPSNPQRYNSNGIRYFYNFATKQIISK